MVQKLLYSLFFLIPFCGVSQRIVLSDQAQVSILTCGTGPESYAMYGHTGIRIKDALQRIDVVYNYGAFDFSTPNFIGKFLKGDLDYFVTNSTFTDFYYTYQAENREIIEQELALSTEQINQLFEQLNAAVYSDERFYTYRFIDQNCTTMVVDKINTLLGTEDLQSLAQTELYREILYPYMTDFYMKLGIELIFGAKVDQPATRLFLPYEFKKALTKTTVNNHKIEKTNQTLLTARETDRPSPILNSIYSLIAGLLLLVILHKKALTVTYFALAGLLGVFFSLVGMYSLHEEVLWNYNLLLFNPLLLLLAVFIWKENTQKALRVGKICLVFLAVYLAYMINKIHLAIVWPFIVLHVFWIGRMIVRKQVY